MQAQLNIDKHKNVLTETQLNIVEEKKLLYRYDSTKKAATNVDKDKKKIIRVEYTKKIEIRLSKRRHAKTKRI